MSENNQTFMILIIVGAFVLFYLYSTRNTNRETFDGSNQLDTFYDGGSTAGIEDFLVDTMTCSKDCCGDQFPAPYDGLTAPELEHNLALQGKQTPFVRTNMMCSGGINEGVGCPCVKKNAYKFLVNRGDNALTGQESCGRDFIEPTLLIRDIPSNSAIGNFAGSGSLFDGVSPRDSDMLSYAEVIQAKKSMRVNTPLDNSMFYQRPMQDLNNVRGV